MPGGGGGDHVEHPALRQPAGQAAQPVVVEVLVQRLVGGERAGPDLARAVRLGRRPQHDLLVAELVVGARASAPARSCPRPRRRGPAGPPGCRDGQGGRYGGLAHATLAGHDDEPGGGEELQRIHVSLRRPSVRRLAIALGRAPPGGAGAAGPGRRAARRGPDRRAGGAGGRHRSRSAGWSTRSSSTTWSEAIDGRPTAASQALVAADELARRDRRLRQTHGRAGRARSTTRRSRSPSGSVRAALAPSGRRDSSWARPPSPAWPRHPHRRLRATRSPSRASSSTSATAASCCDRRRSGPRRPGSATCSARHRGRRRAGAAQHRRGPRRARAPGRTLNTAEVVQQGDELDGAGARAEPRFCKLPLLPRLMHTVASPPVAYLLLMIGLCLLVFEFFTAGVGRGRRGRRRLPGARPATALVALPATGVGVGRDAPGVRSWLRRRRADRCAPVLDRRRRVTLYAVSSLLPLHGLPPVAGSRSLAGIGGVLLAFLVGMPSMVRARFATPTIGREWMIGRDGRGGGGRRPRRRGRSSGRAVAGPDQPGDARSRGATRCGSSPSTAYTLEVEPEVRAARGLPGAARRRSVGPMSDGPRHRSGRAPAGLRRRFGHASRCARHSPGSWPGPPAHTPVFLRHPSLSKCQRARTLPFAVRGYHGDATPAYRWTSGDLAGEGRLPGSTVRGLLPAAPPRAQG